MHRVLLRGALTVLIAFAFCDVGKAAVRSYEFNTAFSGQTSRGTAPFLTLQFDDAVAPGFVRMTASAPGLSASEFVAQMNFNLDPAISASDLFFSNFVINSGTMLQPILSRGDNALEADSGGFFDFQLNFSVSGGGLNRRFNLGESFSFDIDAPGLNANSFDFFSVPPASNGVHLLAAHIQDDFDPLDGWHTVPEPAAASCLLCAIVALLRTKRKNSIAV